MDHDISNQLYNIALALALSFSFDVFPEGHTVEHVLNSRNKSSLVLFDRIVNYLQFTAD